MNLPGYLALQRRVTRVVLAVLVLTVAATGTAFAVKRFTGLPGDAAFSLDGTVVTKADLARRVQLLEAMYGVKAPTGAKGEATFRRDSAKAVAVSMIIDRAAHARHIVIADKSARDTLAGMVSSQLGDDGQAELTKILGQFGVSEQNVLDEVKRQQATAKLFQSVTKKTVAGVTEAGARAYFDADPTRFAVPERRRISNIVVATKAEADRLLTSARRGQAFARLAKTHSLDDATRDSGGDLGLVTRAALETAFGSAAFSTPAGKVFGPVQTKFGWNVGRVVAVQAGKVVTYDQVKSDVLDAVRAQRATRAWTAFLAAAIKKADVDYADRYRPKHPDAPPAQQPGASLTGAAQ